MSVRVRVFVFNFCFCCWFFLIHLKLLIVSQFVIKFYYHNLLTREKQTRNYGVNREINDSICKIEFDNPIHIYGSNINKTFR